MRAVFWIVTGIASFAGLTILGVIAYGLPAAMSLSADRRSGTEELTIEGAAELLRHSDVEGWALVEESRLLVGERIHYCRRNSFDSYRGAFRRGYGYCQQEAYALAGLLQELDFNAWPVHCEHCDFPERKDTGHAWVQVFYEGKVHDIDSKHMDAAGERLLFATRTPPKRYTPLFRIFAGWGSIAGNAFRYYETGSDTSAAY
jgi:hypothetical protein